MRPVRGRRRRRFVPVAVLGLLLLVAAVGGRPAGTLLLVLFTAALPTVVVLHRRLLRSRTPGRAPAVRPMLRTPAQVALAVVIVTGGGVLAVVLVSVLLAVVAAPVVGDGSGLVRLLLVAFVLGPCLSLGRRCGRWWAFVGAAGLLPALVVAMLVGGSISSSGIGLVVLAVLGTGCALALGSLQAEWDAQATMGAARRRAGSAARGRPAPDRAGTALGGRPAAESRRQFDSRGRARSRA